MDCAQFRDLVDLCAADELEEMRAEECRMHAETCEECGRLLAAARAAAGRVADAMRVAAPADGFEEKVRERLRVVPREKTEDVVPAPEGRPAVRRWAFAAAAAALVAVAAGAVFLHMTRNGARVISGALAGGARRVMPAERCTAAEETGIQLQSGARILLSALSSFEADQAHVQLHVGRCYAATAEDMSETNTLTTLVAEGLSAELGGGTQAFLYAGDEEGGVPGAGGVMSSVVDALFPRAYAACPSGRAPLLLVFAGSARVTCGGRKLAVVAGQGIFADAAADGPFDTASLTTEYETNLAKAEELVNALTARIDRYRKVTDSYGKTLKKLSARRDELKGASSNTAEETQELAEIENRIRIVTDAGDAHEKRIAKWELVRDGEKKGRVTPTRHRLDILKSAVRNHRSAMNTLGQ